MNRSSEKQSKRLVLIDGMSVLHRAFHAYPISLATKDGEVTNAVYGFITILLTVIEKIEPTHVIVTWDVGEPTFRHIEFQEYKGKREKPDDVLLGQIERTREVVEALNIPQFGVPGFEADDLIGTIATQGKQDKEAQVVIVTGDRDALQLVDNEQVIVWMPPSTNKFARDRGPQIFDEVAVKAKYNLNPNQIVDLKALMGDGSDNIPGVRGIGPKTATKILETFPSLKEVYEELKTGTGRTRLVEAVGERSVKLLEGGEEMAWMSQKLARIKCDVPVDLNWDACKLSDYDREKVLAIFEKLQFKSLIKKLPKDSWEESVVEIFA